MISAFRLAVTSFGTALGSVGLPSVITKATFLAPGLAPAKPCVLVTRSPPAVSVVPPGVYGRLSIADSRSFVFVNLIRIF